MSRRVRTHVGAAAAFAIVALMLLPMYVRAETTSEVTEVLDVPAYGENDEVANLANESTEWNYETWAYTTPGIFVGGVVKESLLRLDTIVGGTEGALLLTTTIVLQSDYISTGSSRFTVRLPVDAGASSLDFIDQVDFRIYDLGTSGSYQVTKTVTTDHFNITASGLRRVCWQTDVANLAGTPWTTVATPSYLADGRLYAQFQAPLFAGKYYLLATTVHYANGAPMDFFVSGNDLCSDDLLSSRMTYAWNIDPATAFYRSQSFACDWGYSFIFQEGMAAGTAAWNAYVYASDILFIKKSIQVPTATVDGALNLFWDIWLPLGNSLTYSLDVVWTNPDPVEIVLNAAYWLHNETKNFIMASNPENHTWAATLYPDGKYYLTFSILVYIESDTSLDSVLAYQPEAPVDANGSQDDNYILHYSASTSRETVFFSPWMSLSVDWYSLNKSDIVDVAQAAGDLEPGLDFSVARFFDSLGDWLYARGEDAAASEIPGGKIIGGALFAAAMGSYALSVLAEGLYDSAKAFIKSVIDMAITIGTWLWKIGQALWKAITWVIDQLIYHGSTILAMLIYAAAVLIPIFIITLSVKALSIMLKIAKGDLEGAAAEAREVVDTARRVIPGGG